MLLYASIRRLEGWVSLEVGGPVELLKWRSASTLEAAPMWVSPTHSHVDLAVSLAVLSHNRYRCDEFSKFKIILRKVFEAQA